MKEKVKDFGDFNNWKGFVGLYFTKKELRQIAKEIGVEPATVYDFRCVKNGIRRAL